MRERDYRESRICRLLGNPTAYQILRLLADGSRHTPTEIAGIVERSLVTVSLTLRVLRTAELVRYEHKGKSTFYWLKYPEEIRLLETALRRIVDRASSRLRKDQ